jgi:hypothetical protein
MFSVIEILNCPVMGMNAYVSQATDLSNIMLHSFCPRAKISALRHVAFLSVVPAEYHCIIVGLTVENINVIVLL